MPRTGCRRSRAGHSPGPRSHPEAGTGAPRGTECRWRGPSRDFELVRKIRQHFVAALRHEDEVLEANAAVAVAIEPGLDRDDVTRDEVVADSTEVRRLVHGEPDSVPGAVVEAVDEHFS